MQLGDGNNTTAPRAAAVAIGILLLVAFAGLAGCSTSGGGLHTTHFLFVSDGGNNRVLIYDTPFSTGESASVVLGQGDFTTGASGLTAATFNQPANIAEDSAGNIYVGDTLNNRVLQFIPPFSNGMSASVVIGQPDFVTGTPNTTQNGLGALAPLNGGTVGLAFDGSGNLWVADFGNSRILQYKPPFATGMNASLVLGQEDFTSGAGATTNSGLRGPESIAFDASGDLFVAASGGGEILKFTPGGVKTTFASGLNQPLGLAFDSVGNLFVGNSTGVAGGGSILKFTPAGVKSTFATGLFSPSSLAFAAIGNLFVADSCAAHI